MKRIRTLALCILPLMLFVLPLAAQEEKPFSASELDRFIRDWPKVEEWAAARNVEADDVESPAEMALFLQGADLERFMGSLGWKVDRFFFVAGRAASGLMVAETEAQMPEVIREMRQQRDEIRESPDIPAAQKQEMLRHMDDAIAQMQGLDMAGDTGISPAELRLVLDRRDRLKAALDWGE